MKKCYSFSCNQYRSQTLFLEGTAEDLKSRNLTHELSLANFEIPVRPNWLRFHERNVATYMPQFIGCVIFHEKNLFNVSNNEFVSKKLTSKLFQGKFYQCKRVFFKCLSHSMTKRLREKTNFLHFS